MQSGGCDPCGFPQRLKPLNKAALAARLKPRPYETLKLRPYERAWVEVKACRGSETRHAASLRVRSSLM